MQILDGRVDETAGDDVSREHDSRVEATERRHGRLHEFLMCFDGAEVADTVDNVHGRASSFEFFDQRTGSFSENEVETPCRKVSSKFGSDVEMGVRNEGDGSRVMLRAMCGLGHDSRVGSGRDIVNFSQRQSGEVR